MASLEHDLDKLLDSDSVTPERATAILMKHQKKINWPELLRRLADYIEALPTPIEISARAIGEIIKGTVVPAP